MLHSAKVLRRVSQVQFILAGVGVSGLFFLILDLLKPKKRMRDTMPTA